jgi:hypothetical protein
MDKERAAAAYQAWCYREYLDGWDARKRGEEAPSNKPKAFRDGWIDAKIVSSISEVKNGNE